MPKRRDFATPEEFEAQRAEKLAAREERKAARLNGIEVPADGVEREVTLEGNSKAGKVAGIEAIAEADGEMVEAGEKK